MKRKNSAPPMIPSMPGGKRGWSGRTIAATRDIFRSPSDTLTPVAIRASKLAPAPPAPASWTLSPDWPKPNAATRSLWNRMMPGVGMPVSRIRWNGPAPLTRASTRTWLAANWNGMRAGWPLAGIAYTVASPWIDVSTCWCSCWATWTDGERAAMTARQSSMAGFLRTMAAAWARLRGRVACPAR